MVPTWDHVVFQVHGDLVVHHDETWVGDVVRRLTDGHEVKRPDPWSVDDAPGNYLSGQLHGIAGVEVRIDRIEASIKMGQHKSAAYTTGVVAGFTADGNGPVADWVLRVTS